MLTSHARDQIGLQLRGVAERFIEPIGDLIHVIECSRLVELEFGVICSEVTRDLGRMRGFIVGAIAEAVARPPAQPVVFSDGQTFDQREGDVGNAARRIQ